MTYRLHRDIDTAGLSRPAAAVLRELALMAQATGELRYPVTDAQLARVTGYGRTSIKGARLELQAEQRVRVLEPGTGRAGTRYRVELDAAPFEPLEPVVEPVPPVVEPVPPVVPIAPEPTTPAAGVGPEVPTPRGSRIDPFTLVDPSIRASQVLRSSEKHPPTPAAAAPRQGRSEQEIRTEIQTTCPVARRRRQPCANCRLCGTTRRQAERAERLARMERARARSLEVVRRLYEREDDDQDAAEPIDLESIEPRWRHYATKGKR